mmetsp:Transcript_82340/g.182926  ORF Transcript_82340/g.182926 Transcript_82340/m.182926 type:complete len:558 (-) Transcript_82340:87-1760(-)
MGSVCLRPEETPRRSSDGGPQMPEPVVLHVYDIGTSGIGRALNQVLRPLGTGVFHCGVEVYGLEWSYGFNGKGGGGQSGVFFCTPRTNDAHSYRETLQMGQTSLSQHQVKALLAQMAAQWKSKDYDLLRHNCCHFCDALCERLGVNPVPPWVTNMAAAGAACRSMLQQEGQELLLPPPQGGIVPGQVVPRSRSRNRRGRSSSRTRHEVEETEPEAEPERDDLAEIRKWEDMLRLGLPMFKRLHPSKFRRRTRRGLPSKVRWQVWKAALEFNEQEASKDYAALSGIESQYCELIRLDIGRTFSELPEFDEKRQEALFRILNAYANHSPSVGYCQGMNFIAGLLILTSEGNEEEVFGMLVRLMDHVGLNGFYRERMPLLRQYVKASDKLLAEMLPELRNHFLQENVQPAVYLHQWFLTLFINIFPLSMVLIIWDVIMCNGLPSILSVTLAILQLLEEGLLGMHFEEIHMCFKAMKKQKNNKTTARRLAQLLMRRTEDVDVPEHILEYLQKDIQHTDAYSDDGQACHGDQEDQFWIQQVPRSIGSDEWGKSGAFASFATF